MILFGNMKCFGNKGENSGSEERTPETSHPADDDHGHHLDRIIEIVRAGTDKGNVMGIKTAGYGCEHGT